MNFFNLKNKKIHKNNITMKTTHNELQKYINNHYNEIKRTLKKEYRKLNTSDFDEDIFHETLIKCIEIFETKETFNENDFMPYIITAFKTNVIRSAQYFSNSMKSNTDVENINVETNNKIDIDFNLILNDVKNTFGYENYEKFMDWIENKSIKEINENYNCNNSRYIIDKIRNYINKTYNNDFKT